MDGYPNSTKQELNMLCEWARDGKLRALKGYLLAGVTYYRDWGLMDGRRVMTFCRELVRAAAGAEKHGEAKRYKEQHGKRPCD